jgi:V8-like Glu-specific endopeptidase
MRTASVLVTAALLVAVTPSAAISQQSPQTRVLTDVSTNTTTHDRTYWTDERIRWALATPVETPTATDSNPSLHPRSDGRTVTVDPVLPKGFTADIGPTAVSKSGRIGQPTAWPNRMAGKLLSSKGHCSAGIIASNNKNTVWTAAHCLYDRKTKKFLKDFLFMPAYKNGTTPYGKWNYARVHIPKDFAATGDLRWSDMGAIVFKKHPTLGNLQDAVGAFGYQFGGGPKHTDVQAWGYPLIGYGRPNSDFANGQYMMYCRGNVTDASAIPRDNRMRMACDMGGGGSGGPWVKGMAARKPLIVGINGHRNTTSTGKYKDISLYSSEHTANAIDVINLAKR